MVGALRGSRMVSAIARVKTEALDALLDASGEEGVFARKVFRTEGARDEHRVVWLRGDTLGQALERRRLAEGGELEGKCRSVVVDPPPAPWPAAGATR